jgi:hypothetical protein
VDAEVTGITQFRFPTSNWENGFILNCGGGYRFALSRGAEIAPTLPLRF